MLFGNLDTITTVSKYKTKHFQVFPYLFVKSV